MSLKNRKSRVSLPSSVDRAKGIAECPLNRCMELMSGAWAPHVVWHLSGEPRRFSELKRDITTVSARVLSQRLRELEARGLLAREVMPTSPPSVEYALTPLGRLLVPAVSAIAEVGAQLARTPVPARSRRGNTVRRPPQQRS